MDTVMARLTDNSGTLLGGLETPHLLLLPRDQTQQQAAAVKAPAAPPRPPEYGPGEIVFALRCAYRTLPTLGYSAAPSAQTVRRFGCDTLIEEPKERHYCPACGSYYCTAHAEGEAHNCGSILRGK
jgi:hypothetical protein